MPFRFAMAPPSISGGHQLLAAAYRSAYTQHNVEIDAECRPIAGGDDSEITCVQSSSHHVTDLDPYQGLLCSNHAENDV